jgi:ParB family chromosome partitioning protein
MSDANTSSGRGGRARGLGRGLSALFGEASDPAPQPVDLSVDVGVRVVAIELMRPSGLQPRRMFKPDALDALAESIRTHGVIEPLVVRPLAGEAGRFEIIAGERRWRAAQRAGLHEVPVVVRDTDDKGTLEIALIENLEREDLTAIEEAQAFQRLLSEFGYTQEVLAQRLSRSRPYITNSLRLLKLPVGVQRMIDDATLTAGHARALLAASDPEKLAGQVASRRLSVRETERLVSRDKTPEVMAPTPAPLPRGRIRIAPVTPVEQGDPQDADRLALERQLTEMLGLDVRLEVDGDGRRSGRVVVSYQTLEQLDEVVQRLSRAPG